jgi:uncharacterized protein YyaL (SSP411 family)
MSGSDRDDIETLLEELTRLAQASLSDKAPDDSAMSRLTALQEHLITTDSGDIDAQIDTEYAHYKIEALRWVRTYVEDPHLPELAASLSAKRRRHLATLPQTLSAWAKAATDAERDRVRDALDNAEREQARDDARERALVELMSAEQRNRYQHMVRSSGGTN